MEIKKSDQGGLSIVIQRPMAANVTPIRPNGKICKSVCSLDCNSMYLGTLYKPMPLQHFCTYSPPNFIRQKSFEFGILAHEWLTCYSHRNDVEIRHKFNHKTEFKVNGIYVDGYSPAKNTIYQFHGCYWHGCCAPECTLAYKTNPDGSI